MDIGSGGPLRDARAGEAGPGGSVRAGRCVTPGQVKPGRVGRVWADRVRVRVSVRPSVVYLI